MRWTILAMLALLALAPAQANFHADETNEGTGEGNMDDGGMGDGGDGGDTNTGDDTDITVEDDDTVGAGRDEGNGMSTPWTILMVLGVLVVIGVIVALFFAARDRPPRY